MPLIRLAFGLALLVILLPLTVEAQRVGRGFTELALDDSTSFEFAIDQFISQMGGVTENFSIVTHISTQTLLKNMSLAAGFDEPDSCLVTRWIQSPVTGSTLSKQLTLYKRTGRRAFNRFLISGSDRTAQGIHTGRIDEDLEGDVRVRQRTAQRRRR